MIDGRWGNDYSHLGEAEIAKEVTRHKVGQRVVIYLQVKGAFGIGKGQSPLPKEPPNKSCGAGLKETRKIQAFEKPSKVCP